METVLHSELEANIYRLVQIEQSRTLHKVHDEDAQGRME
jgi:hypothetical protein